MTITVAGQIKAALIHALNDFSWRRTPQGSQYWMGVYQALADIPEYRMRGSGDLLVPAKNPGDLGGNLQAAFNWRETKQGTDYWRTVIHNLQSLPASCLMNLEERILRVEQNVVVNGTMTGRMGGPLPIAGKPVERKIEPPTEVISIDTDGHIVIVSGRARMTGLEAIRLASKLKEAGEGARREGKKLLPRKRLGEL